MEIIHKSLALATEAHQGQFDKLGVPYIKHPEAVAFVLTLSPAFHFFDSEDKVTALSAAYLHDVVEDTDYSLNDLLALGFNESIVDAVSLLTFDNKKHTREEYYNSILRSPVARAVKVADLIHNNYHSRVVNLSEEQQERLALKYGKAKKILLKENEYDFFQRATG